MDPDIIDILDAGGHDDDEEHSDEEGLVVDEVVEDEQGDQTPLEMLGKQVKENLRILGSPAPVDPSPLTLESLRDKYPQVHCAVIFNFGNGSNFVQRFWAPFSRLHPYC